jgi:hypothetical protein
VCVRCMWCVCSVCAVCVRCVVFCVFCANAVQGKGVVFESKPGAKRHQDLDLNHTHFILVDSGENSAWGDDITYVSLIM